MNDSKELLLCLHKTGAFRGLYTGIIEPCSGSAELEQAAIRGCEAAGIVLTDTAALHKRAVLDMVEVDDGETTEEHEFVYTGAFTGTPKASRQSAYAWFAIGAIPYADMPEDDAVWYPRVLEGKLLKGRFEFGASGMTAHSVEAVDSLAQ